MTEADLPAVRAIETEAFETTWDEAAFLNELKRNPAAHYLVLREGDELLGYAGIWMVEDEAHITSVAITPARRNAGLGRRLMVGLLERCLELGARWVTLEVKDDNLPAHRLYDRFGFVKVGVRQGYYVGGQNALIMWAGNLRSRPFQERLARLTK